MHDAGEMDVRACYTAISVSTLSCLLFQLVIAILMHAINYFHLLQQRLFFQTRLLVQVYQRKISLEKLAEKGKRNALWN